MFYKWPYPLKRRNFRSNTLYYHVISNRSRIQYVNIFFKVDEFKKFPDLLELEMAQFAMKCEKFYDQQMEKSLKNSKKIRWCNFCQNAARFHCCFSAAYCSRICQVSRLMSIYVLAVYLINLHYYCVISLVTKWIFAVKLGVETF